MYAFEVAHMSLVLGAMAAVGTAIAWGAGAFEIGPLSSAPVDGRPLLVAMVVLSFTGGGEQPNGETWSDSGERGQGMPTRPPPRTGGSA